MQRILKFLVVFDILIASIYDEYESQLVGINVADAVVENMQNFDL